MSDPEQSGMALPGAGNRRRSSLFEIPSRRFLIPQGSSIMSFSHEPKIDEFQPPQKEKMTKYENTFRMDPPVRFKADKVNAIIKEVLFNHLEGRSYDPISSSLLCKTMSDEIKHRVADLKFDRYKVVALVTIGQKKDQCMRCGSRCVWDVDRDTYSSATYENPHLYAMGMVYACYYE